MKRGLDNKSLNLFNFYPLRVLRTHLPLIKTRGGKKAPLMVRGAVTIGD